MKDPREFLESVRVDLFPEEVYVFTPKGEVKEFPRGATPLDFAYSIHSDIGQHCQGAKVDGKMVALNTPLRNGQVVEIITQKNARPSQDWLKIAKTHQALNKIRQWISKNKRQIFQQDKETKEDQETIKKEPPKPEQTVKQPAKQFILKPIVEVAGDPKITTTLAKCCNPAPPDDIIGYITLNQRITVHRRSCRNVAKVKDPKRLVSVNWKKES